METFESHSPEDTFAIGRQLGQRLAAGDCMALLGDLGAGKTALTRGIAAGFGADVSLVSSPTYVLVQQYPASQSRSLFHLDLYRMGDPEMEFIDLGTEDMLAEGALVIEWADRATSVLPHPRYELHIEITGPTHRTMTLRRIEH